jgi:hypothetical protein
MVVVGMSLSLFGCDDSAKWFAKPLNPLSNSPGYTYSSLGDARLIAPLSPMILSTPMAPVRTILRRQRHRARRPVQVRARRLRTMQRSLVVASRWE